jgi:RNA polymerase sigma-70 factor, ECF subfamily
VHAQSPSPAATNWDQIVRLYDLLFQADPSPAVELNRAVAVAMRDGPLARLVRIDATLARGDQELFIKNFSRRVDLGTRRSTH